MMEDGSISYFPVGRRRHRASVVFRRDELVSILDIYGRMVSAGQWRDYSIGAGADEAVFAVFRRSSEMPVFRIVKRPALALRQGLFAVIAMDGRILKRGRELRSVLNVFERKLLKLVD